MSWWRFTKDQTNTEDRGQAEDRRVPRLDLDEDGQPRNRHWNGKLRHDRAVNELLGMLKGILADGEVGAREVSFLMQWMLANVEDWARWPFSELLPKFVDISADGVADRLECEDLAELFRKLTGTDSQTHSSVIEHGDEWRNAATRLPLTDPPPDPLRFEGRCFVFTGKLVYGPRSKCHQAVEDRGGYCAEEVTARTDILVIGEIGSRDWKHSSFGNKIKKAAESSRRIEIISEEHWRRFL
jgi:NAD-dependent DNA ligase